MALKLITVAIDEALSLIRLDKALASHPEIASRTRASQLIHRGLVTCRGSSVSLKPSYKTSTGEVFEIALPLVKQTSELVAYDFPLEIEYEDQYVIVVLKPAGLVVHPAAGHMNDTLVNALIHHCKDLSMGFGEQRPGLVHRLDKDTSGLLVIAKDDRTQEHLAKQFKEKTVHRIYWALVYGEFKEVNGTIRSYLRRHPVDRKKFASEKISDKRDPTGKWAVTHYTQIATVPAGISLVRCQLETGRTHQIRVHLSEASHPIVGDVLYGASNRTKHLKSTKLRKQIKELNRIALHAAELGFIHPATGETLLFKSGWPSDLKPLITELHLDEY